MASYTFHRLTTAGVQERGMLNLAAPDPVTAMEYLERDGSVVVDVSPVPAILRPFSRLRAYGFRRVSRAETAQCLETLASYLGSGLILSEALQDLRGQTKTPELRQILSHLLVDVQAGVSLSRSMSRHGHVFSPTVLTMAGVGEEVGELPAQLKAAAEHLRHMDEIARLSRRILAYPLITLTVLLGVFGFWVLKVVPALAETFTDMGRDLPGAMQAALWLSHALSNHGLTLLAALIGCAVLLWLGVKKTSFLRRCTDTLLLRLPFIGPVVSLAAGARVLELFGALLSNGVDPDRSLTLAWQAMTNSHYRNMLENARSMVSGGVSLSEALRRGGVLEDAAVRMLHAGERTGRLKEHCDLAAAEYRRRLHHSVQMLSKMMEPFLLVVFTLLLAFFILGFLAPVYQSLGGF